MKPLPGPRRLPFRPLGHSKHRPVRPPQSREFLVQTEGLLEAFPAFEWASAQYLRHPFRLHHRQGCKFRSPGRVQI